MNNSFSLVNSNTVTWMFRCVTYEMLLDLQENSAQLNFPHNNNIKLSAANSEGS